MQAGTLAFFGLEPPPPPPPPHPHLLPRQKDKNNYKRAFSPPHAPPHPAPFFVCAEDKKK